MRLILMGTGPFAVPSFDAIRQSGHEIRLVVTKPEPPVRSRKGPPPAPVRTWAMDHDLAIFDPPSINDDEAIEKIRRCEPELLVVCDYGQILSRDALSVSSLGGINLHGSLLPAYRGAAPVQRSLLSGDRTTGVTVIHMTPQLDGGPILGTRETEIRNDETAGQLEERLSQLGIELTLRSLELLAAWDGQSPIGSPQDPSLVSKAPRLHKSEALIDWTQTALQIDCHVRGMQPWPIAYTHVKTNPSKPPVRLAVLQVERCEADVADLKPGELAGGKELVVATGDVPLKITSLRPAGKREMTGAEFLRGHELARRTELTSQ